MGLTRGPALHGFSVRERFRARVNGLIVIVQHDSARRAEVLRCRIKMLVPVHVAADTIAAGQKVIVGGRASGRRVVVLRAYDGSLRCLDYSCFHHGGDLGGGDVVDIEDAGTLLRCPAHGYCIKVDTGEWMEQVDGRWQSRGVVQRTHTVHTDGEGRLLLQLDESAHALPSDAYNIPHAETPPRAAQTIAFQCRKQHACTAVRAKLELQSASGPSAQQPTLPELLAQERARPKPMDET